MSVGVAIPGLKAWSTGQLAPRAGPVGVVGVSRSRDPEDSEAEHGRHGRHPDFPRGLHTRVNPPWGGHDPACHSPERRALLSTPAMAQKLALQRPAVARGTIAGAVPEGALHDTSGATGR